MNINPGWMELLQLLFLDSLMLTIFLKLRRSNEDSSLNVIAKLLKVILSIALHIPTAHDFCVIIAHS